MGLTPRTGADVSRAGPSERAVFQRAIERGNLLVAETTARQIGPVSLVESRTLTALIVQKDPRRRSRVAARWLLRFLEAHNQVGIEEAAAVASSFAAFGGLAHDAALAMLIGMAERSP